MKHKRCWSQYVSVQIASHDEILHTNKLNYLMTLDLLLITKTNHSRHFYLIHSSINYFNAYGRCCPWRAYRYITKLQVSVNNSIFVTENLLSNPRTLIKPQNKKNVSINFCNSFKIWPLHSHIYEGQMVFLVWRVGLCAHHTSNSSDLDPEFALFYRHFDNHYIAVSVSPSRIPVVSSDRLLLESLRRYHYFVATFVICHV